MDEESRHVRSDELRTGLRSLLNEVERDGAHLEIRRYNTPSAMLVPIEWYQQARVALAMEAAR